MEKVKKILLFFHFCDKKTPFSTILYSRLIAKQEIAFEGGFL